jgi:photosystem II stability/assembly factor-like uncharacterized protein
MPRLGTAAALVLIAMAPVLGCGGGDEDEPTAGPIVEDPGPIHVHGLGTNPRDDALFIATHTGLFRVGPGETKATRVGGTYQDTMGFTVVGPDRFLGSGHPDGRQKAPPFLGLIESTDGGETWSPISLRGQSDFHVLEAAGDHVYGFGSDWESRRAQFLVSSDGGKTWDEREAPEPLIALAIHPDDPQHLFASGERGLYESTTGGQDWSDRPGDPGLVDWRRANELVLISGGGQAMTSSDGRKWTRGATVGGQPAAFEAERDGLYVALHDGTIKRSRDGGRSWTIRSTP